MNPIALVDMDGTLADFSSRLEEEMRKLQSPGEPPFSAALFDYSEPHLNERMKLIKRQEGFWTSLKPLRGGMKILGALCDFSYDITILTKGPRRSPIAWREKVEWCDKHLSHISHTTTITENKSLVYGKVLVDDYPEYIKPWLEWRPRGLVIMPDQPWNQGFEHPQVFRYNDDIPGEIHKVRDLLAKTACDFRDKTWEAQEQGVPL